MGLLDNIKKRAMGGTLGTKNENAIKKYEEINGVGSANKALSGVASPVPQVMPNAKPIQNIPAPIVQNVPNNPITPQNTPNTPDSMRVKYGLDKGYNFTEKEVQTGRLQEGAIPTFNNTGDAFAGERRTAESQAKLQEMIQRQQMDITPVENSTKTPDSVVVNTASVEQQQKDAQIKQQAEVERFTSILKSTGDMKEMSDIVKSNPQYRDKFNNVLKQHILDTKNAGFFKKYANTEASVLHESVLSGEVVVGSEKYNMLPEETRKAYERFSKVQAPILASDTSFSWSDAVNKTLSFEEIYKKTQEVFSSSLASKRDELLKQPQMVQAQERLRSSQEAVNNHNLAMLTLEEDFKKQRGGMPSSMAQSSFASEYRDMVLQGIKLNGTLQLEQSTLENLKDDVDTQISLFAEEENMNREAYKSAIGIFNEERARNDMFSMKDFEEKSKMKFAEFEKQSQVEAEERQRSFQTMIDEKDKEFTREMKDFDIKNRPGTYEVDYEGNLMYIKDGKAEQVLGNDGEVVAVKKYQGYADNLKENKNGGYDIIRTYDDGRKPDFFSYGVSGNSNISMQVFDYISQIETPVKGKYGPGLQCGEGVNIYLKNAGISNITMGSDYADKSVHINSQTPQVGGLAVWNPGGVNAKFGHTGIVTGYNPETGKVTITDWNRKNDGQKSTYEVGVDQINNSDGGFVHIKSSTTEGGNNTFDLSDVESFNSLTNTEKADLRGNPIYMDFLKKKDAITSDPNANPYDVIEMSRGGKDLGQTEVESITKYSQALSSISEIEKTISGKTKLGFGAEKTGPIVGFFRSANPYDVTAQALKAQITSLIPNLARGVYGEVGVLTEADVALYRQTVPNLTQTEDVNKAVLGMTLRVLKNGMTSQIQDLARGGRDVSGYEGKLRSIDMEIETIENSIVGKTTNQENTKPQTGSLLNEYDNFSGYSDIISK